MTDCITEYIRFCEDTTMPAQTVYCFSNNKPWRTSDLKALLNKKKRAFRSGDREEQWRVQHELRDMLRTCKDNYRRKLEAKLSQQNNVRDVWTGMKHITGMKGKDRQTSGSLDRANQFNHFLQEEEDAFTATTDQGGGGGRGGGLQIPGSGDWRQLGAAGSRRGAADGPGANSALMEPEP
ncbi:hypothetical protein L3Q82_001764 [Scortum barcoo]|uniref:Uncharacterized protein n=1 Tax=Scortum barcoo TaxID=214431 RepID=A0ACB8W3X6_9TELE|nr:hypothetical protein L3Q82_001764 [Scortum barcoo]